MSTRIARIALVTLLLASSMTIVACQTLGIAVGYKPLFIPVKFTVDSNGNVSAQAEASIITFIGEFSVETEYGLEDEIENVYLVFRRLLDGGGHVDMVYRAEMDQEALVAVMGRSGSVEVVGNRVIVPVKPGDNGQIVITRPEDQDRAVATLVAATQESRQAASTPVPSDVTGHDSGGASADGQGEATVVPPTGSGGAGDVGSAGAPPASGAEGAGAGDVTPASVGEGEPTLAIEQPPTSTPHATQPSESPGGYPGPGASSVGAQPSPTASVTPTVTVTPTVSDGYPPPASTPGGAGYPGPSDQSATSVPPAPAPGSGGSGYPGP